MICLDKKRNWEEKKKIERNICFLLVYLDGKKMKRKKMKVEIKWHIYPYKELIYIILL